METYLLITDRKSNTNIWTMLTHYQINIRARVIGVSIQHHTVTPHLYNFRTWPCVVEYMFSKWNVKIFRYLATRAEFFPFFFFFKSLFLPTRLILILNLHDIFTFETILRPPMESCRFRWQVVSYEIIDLTNVCKNTVYKIKRLNNIVK